MTLEEQVAEYVELRDKKAAISAKAKELTGKLDKKMTELGCPPTDEDLAYRRGYQCAWDNAVDLLYAIIKERDEEFRESQ